MDWRDLLPRKFLPGLHERFGAAAALNSIPGSDNSSCSIPGEIPSPGLSPVFPVISPLPHVSSGDLTMLPGALSNENSRECSASHKLALVQGSPFPVPSSGEQTWSCTCNVNEDNSSFSGIIQDKSFSSYPSFGSQGSRIPA